MQSQTAENYGIISFKEKLLFKARISTQSETLSIIQDNKRYSIEASNLFKLQLAANYKFIGFSIGFSPQNKNSDFVSNFLESQLRFFIKKQWIQTFNYSNVQGFYLEDVEPLQFPNLKTINWTGSTAYIYNPKFSLKHLLHQNEWQQFSAGSIIPSLKYGFNRISDIVENQKVIQNNFDIILSTPYYYTWCFKNNWFFSPNLSPALGIRFSTDKTVDNKVKKTYLTKAFSLGLQYGYTSNKISAGATFNFNSNSINNKFTRESTNDTSYANIYFAYRIEPPDFLKRSVDKINKKLGL